MRTRIGKGTEVYAEGKLTLGRWVGGDGTPRAGLNLSAWPVQPNRAGGPARATRRDTIPF
jgi:hypothetical protein